MDNDWVILRDGLAVFEAKDICRMLETGKVDFMVDQVSGEEAGIVYSRRDNWSAGLSKVLNYFNQGGLGVLLQISVRPEERARAEAVLAPRAVSATIVASGWPWVLRALCCSCCSLPSCSESIGLVPQRMKNLADV